MANYMSGNDPAVYVIPELFFTGIHLLHARYHATMIDVQGNNNTLVRRNVQFAFRWREEIAFDDTFVIYDLCKTYLKCRMIHNKLDNLGLITVKK